MTRSHTKTLASILSITALNVAVLVMADRAAAQPGPPDLPAASAPASESGSLTLTYAGIKTPTGAVMVALYDSQEGYESGKAVRLTMIPVGGDSASTVIGGLAPGAYAIKSFHDVDGDGKMGANPFGIPTEPYAFSNDAKGSMGPARWSAARFEIGAGDNTQTIHID